LTGYDLTGTDLIGDVLTWGRFDWKTNTAGDARWFIGNLATSGKLRFKA